MNKFSQLKPAAMCPAIWYPQKDPPGVVQKPAGSEGVKLCKMIRHEFPGPCNYRNLNQPSLYFCACCGVCVPRVAGPKTRRPPSSPLADLRLYKMNGSDWSDRYPRVIEEAARIKGAAILDAEVVCLNDRGVRQFDTLHSRTAVQEAVACAFDLLMRDDDDLRRRPLIERKAALGKLLIRSRGGIQYVEHAEGQQLLP
jgi:hypothetical protein